MYTRCPTCSCTFRVTATILQMAEGDVRCGACGGVFNALQTLVDDPSDASDFTVPGAPKLVHPGQPAPPPAPSPSPSTAPDGTMEFDVPENEWQRFFITPPPPPPDRVEPALGAAFEAIVAAPASAPAPGSPDAPAAELADRDDGPGSDGSSPVAAPVARRTLEEETADTDTWKGFLREAEALAAPPDAEDDTDEDADDDTGLPFVVEGESDGDAPTVLVRRSGAGSGAHDAIAGPDADPQDDDEPEDDELDEFDDGEDPDREDLALADAGADADHDEDDDLDPSPFTPPPDDAPRPGTAPAGLHALAADPDGPPAGDGIAGPQDADTAADDVDRPGDAESGPSGDPLDPGEDRHPGPDADPWRDPDALPGLAAAARRPDPGADTVLDWGPPPFAGRTPGVPTHAGRWFAASLVAAVALGAQLVHYSRDALAADPSWGPTTRSLYARLGVPLNPGWPLEAYEIRGAKAIAENTAPGALDIVAEIAVTGDQPVGAPLVRVVLRDRWSNAVASGVFDAGTYLAEAPPATGVYPPGTLIPVAISLADPGAAAQGYELDVCLPNRQLGLQCRAARDPFRR